MKHEKYKKQTSLSSRMKFESIVSKADIIIAGNSILEEAAKQYNKNTIVIPSVIETDNMPQKNYDEPVIVSSSVGLVEILISLSWNCSETCSKGFLMKSR